MYIIKIHQWCCAHGHYGVHVYKLSINIVLGVQENTTMQPVQIMQKVIVMTTMMVDTSLDTSGRGMQQFNQMQFEQGLHACALMLHAFGYCILLLRTCTQAVHESLCW